MRHLAIMLSLAAGTAQAAETKKVSAGTPSPTSTPEKGADSGAAKPVSTPKEKAATKVATPKAGETFSADQARDVIKTAEKIRSPEKAEIKVTLSTTSPEKKIKYEMKILRTTNRRGLVEFQAPELERGRYLLALQRNYYGKFRDAKGVVPISRKEMIGDSLFSIFDLFQLDPDKDFVSKILARENGPKGRQLKVEMVARPETDAPYSRVIYYVEEKGYFPLGAEFYGESGKLLKKMVVKSREMLAGMVRGKQTRMTDEVVKGHESVWVNDAMEEKDVPDSLFTQDYLRGL